MKNQLAKEALERSLLMMKYDTSKTLTENEIKVKSLLKEGELEGMKSLLNKCSEGNLGDPFMTGQEQEEIAGMIYQSFKGAGTDEEMFEQAIDMMNKSGGLADLCAISKNYQEMAGEDLADGIDGDVGGMWGFGGSLMTKAHTVFRKMFKRTQDQLTIMTQKGKDINFFRKQFPCIFQSANKWCVKPQSGCGPVEPSSGKYNFIRIKDQDGAEHLLYETGEIMKPDETFTGYYMSCQNGMPTPSQSKPSMNENHNLKKKSLNEWKIPQGGGQQGGGQQGGGQQGGGQQGGGGASGFDQATANLQQQLYNAGFYIGNTGQLKNGVDGQIGGKTRAAQQAFMNGEKCGDFNKKNNYPNPPTCKEVGGATVQQDKEILTINPNDF